jgi:hypothetical protein
VRFVDASFWYTLAVLVYRRRDSAAAQHALFKQMALEFGHIFRHMSRRRDLWMQVHACCIASVSS